MTQFARLFTLSLQKIKINTPTVEIKGTWEFNREFNSQTKLFLQQNQNRVVKPNLLYRYTSRLPLLNQFLSFL